MRIKVLLAFITTTIISTAAWAAQVSDPCTRNTECSSDGHLVCVASNCLEAGKFTITLAWNADTDLDLSVETPGGSRIGAADVLEAESGRLTVDECYDAERCGANEHPHVEHVVWGFDDSTPLGRYRLEILNFDGRSDAEYRIYVTRPDGHRFVLEGHVEAGEGAKSSESFKMEATTSCSDRDHDGLCDTWETDGIDFDEDGIVDLDLAALGANPYRKDIFVEVDWMPGAKPYGLTSAVAAFANAPVENPDGSTGIELHIEMSDQVETLGTERVAKEHALDDEDLIVARFGSRDVDADATSCDAGWFGSPADRRSDRCEAIIRAKKQVYRYGIFAYRRAGTSSSGRGELPGDEFIVSTKSWRSNDQDLENATFMHELGHNLGLFHGGFDNHGCKPNYLSLMNYLYQTGATWAGRPLDYSRSKLQTIDERALIEFDGISGPATWEQVAFHAPNGDLVVTDADASQPIDWDQNGDLDIDLVSVHVSDGYECSQPGVARELESHDDWSALIYNFRLTKNYGVAWGDDEALEEITEEQHQRMARASDSDVDGHDNLSDNCPSTANPRQSDADSDGVGDACDRCPEAPAPGYSDGCKPEELAELAASFKTPTRAEAKEPRFVEPRAGCSAAGGRLSWSSIVSAISLWILIVGRFTRRRRSRRRGYSRLDL